MSDWTQAYARALGIKWTPQVGSRLSSWQRWEGGSTNNSATNNYMNTKMSMPGSWDAIGNGVQGYHTLAQGAQAFARTINNGAYSPALKSWLATGQGDPSHDLGVWVAGPGGATSPSAQAYASKVLGTHVADSPSNLGPTAPLPKDTPGNLGSGQLGVTPDASTSFASDASAIRAQAAKGFGDIAAGGDAIKSFGDMTGLLQTLHSSIPSFHPATVQAAQADPNGLDAKAVSLAQKYLGVKYTWGGTSAKTGFDCSGLVQHVWASLGVKIPRTTYAQWDAGSPVAAKDLKAGDEVFFTGSDPMNGKPGHEGLYIGGGKFIEAPGTGMQVRVSSLAGRRDYVGARRFA